MVPITSLRLLSPQERAYYSVDAGVIVEQAGRKLASEGIRNGLVITEINGQLIRTIEQLEDILTQGEQEITIKGLYRKGRKAEFTFKW